MAVLPGPRDVITWTVEVGRPARRARCRPPSTSSLPVKNGSARCPRSSHIRRVCQGKDLGATGPGKPRRATRRPARRHGQQQAARLAGVLGAGQVDRDGRRQRRRRVAVGHLTGIRARSLPSGPGTARRSDGGLRIHIVLRQHANGVAAGGQRTSCRARMFSPGRKSQAYTITPYPALSSSARSTRPQRSASAWLTKKSTGRSGSGICPSGKARTSRWAARAPGHAVQQSPTGLALIHIYQVDVDYRAEQRDSIALGHPEGDEAPRLTSKAWRYAAVHSAGVNTEDR